MVEIAALGSPRKPVIHSDSSSYLGARPHAVKVGVYLDVVLDLPENSWFGSKEVSQQTLRDCREESGSQSPKTSYPADMNARQLIWTPLFLLLAAAPFQLPAQQPETDRKRFEEIKAKAEKGDAQAQVNLGVRYANGGGVTKDAGEAVKWYRKAAEQDHGQAQFNLGLSLYKGKGVRQDHAEAVKWFRQAADQGHANAQFNLGLCYLGGKGVPQDHAEAAKWFRKAADQGDASAQFNLHVCYDNGEGLPQDRTEAYKWLLLAAAQGDKDAREVVPKLERQLTREQLAEGQKRASTFKPPEVSSLEAGQSAVSSKELADLRAQAEKGDAKAQNELGEVLYAGKAGVAKNPVEAVKWFRQAAEQHHAAAQSNLGVCYERGEGVAKYEAEAYKWDLLAAAQGDNKAKRNASLLELMLSREEVADGKRRAQDWLEQRKKSSSDNR